MVSCSDIAIQLGTHLIHNRKLSDGLVLNIKSELKSIGYPVSNKTELAEIVTELDNYLHKVSYSCRFKNNIFIELSEVTKLYNQSKASPIAFSLTDWGDSDE